MAPIGSPPQLGAMTAAGRGEISVLAAGGGAVALGSAGVVVTSVFYALSPSAAALPAQPLDRALALAGSIAGARIMYAAGTVGIFADLVMAAGALLITAELVRRTRGLAAIGWAVMLLSIIIFIFVDAIVAHVLGPLAATKDGAVAFVGFKRLFDVLFLLGTVAFGAGAILALGSDLRASAPLARRPLSLIGVLAGLATVIAAVACFFGFPLEQGVGISIGFGAALFVAIGLQIARAT